MGLTTGRQHTLWLAEWKRERSLAALTLRMLMLADPLPEADARAALGDDLFTALRDSGLILFTEMGWASPFALSFMDDLFFFSDRTGTAPDTVLAVSNTTQLLSRASCSTIGDNACGLVLDLGCGCGALAIQMAKFSKMVIATDLNPRALALAAFNAVINDVHNITFLQGDLYSPLRGMEFDLIVCQPPYVPQLPGVERIVFLHGGADGDEVALRVLRGVGDHLRPGGRLVLLNDWPVREGEELSIPERVRAALNGLPVHVVVLVSDDIEVSAYCASYARPSQLMQEESLVNEIRFSLDYFASQGIIAMRQALCTIERSVDGSYRASQLPVPTERWSASRRTDIDRIFAAMQFQADGLHRYLSATVRTVPGMTFIMRWTDLLEEGDVFAQPPSDALFPTLRLERGTLELIRTLNAAPDLRAALVRLADAAGLPPENLYLSVENALMVGLSRGILELRDANAHCRLPQSEHL